MSKPKNPERDALRTARRLAASAEKKSAIHEWLERREAMRLARGGELVLPDHTADLAEIQARLRARALTILEDVMVNSTSERNQLRAIELTLAMDAGRSMRVPISMVSATVQPAAALTAGDDEAVPVVTIPEDNVARVHDLLVLHRKLQQTGGV